MKAGDAKYKIMVLEMEKETLQSDLFASNKKKEKLMSLLHERDESISRNGKFSALKLHGEKAKYQDLLENFKTVQNENVSLRSSLRTQKQNMGKLAKLLRDKETKCRLLKVEIKLLKMISGSGPGLKSSRNRASVMRNDAIESQTMRIDSSTLSQCIPCPKLSHSNSQSTVQNSTQNPTDSTKFDIYQDHNYSAGECEPLTRF